MFNHNTNFEFIGFNPEHEVIGFATLVADRLHSLAPSDSFMKVAIKKVGDATEATCKIASQAGTFFAEAACNCPITAIHQIEDKIKQQINEWKKYRFLDNQLHIRTSRPHHIEVAV